MRIKDLMTTNVLTVQPGPSSRTPRGCSPSTGSPGCRWSTTRATSWACSRRATSSTRRRAPRQAGLLSSGCSRPPPALDLKLAAKTVGEAMSAPAVTIGPKRPRDGGGER